MDRLEKMALGRRAAYLRRCIQVAELLALYETDCSVRKRIFYKHIKPVIKCSYTTFNNMLNVPNPAKELEEIEGQLQTSNTYIK